MQIPGSESYLQSEVKYLHHWLFGRKISLDSILIDEYIRAHRVLNLLEGIDVEIDVEQMLQKDLDPIAVEYFARRKSKKNVLTRKFHLLSYLLESDPTYRRILQGEQPQGILKSGFKILWAVFSSACLLLKGWLIARTYHVV